MQPPFSPFHELQARVTIHEQKNRPIHHLTPYIMRRFTSPAISKLREESLFVGRSLARHVWLNGATRVWRCLARQMLVCCVVSYLAAMVPRPKTDQSEWHKQTRRVKTFLFTCPNGARFLANKESEMYYLEWKLPPRSPLLKMTAIALIMEAVRTSETSVYFNETTRRYIPESCLHLPPWEPEILRHLRAGFLQHLSGITGRQCNPLSKAMPLPPRRRQGREEV
jgi:hypothetical protein